jgi:hypothetical protein
MKLIFMQDTINFMHKLDPNSLSALAYLGAPEVVEMENGTKYYKYVEKEDQRTGKEE